jgi:hypothetical protein
MTVSIDTKKKLMTIVIPMQEPTASASGKTLVIASTHGNVGTGVKLDGKEVKIGLNAYIPNK